MNREISSKALEIDFVRGIEDWVEDIIWAESEPSGISSEINKNCVTVYYSPRRFPKKEFIERLKAIESIKSLRQKVIYKRDWNKKWQKSIKPVWIAEDIVILPPFKVNKKNLESVKKIIINPAMAFGTGHHESTQGIMRLMYIHSELFDKKGIADFGCGSGILSIFSRMLGSNVVDAYDFDPECRQAVRENTRLNGIRGIRFFQERVDRCKHKYDIILANMLFGEIMENRSTILKSLKKGGYLFLSGLLSVEREGILGAFKRFALVDELIINDWISLLLRKI